MKIMFWNGSVNRYQYNIRINDKCYSKKNFTVFTQVKPNVTNIKLIILIYNEYSIIHL